MASLVLCAHFHGIRWSSKCYQFPLTGIIFCRSSNNNDEEEVKISPINIGATPEIVSSREGVIKKPKLVFPASAMPKPDLGHKRRQSAPVSVELLTSLTYEWLRCNELLICGFMDIS